MAARGGPKDRPSDFKIIMLAIVLVSAGGLGVVLLASGSLGGIWDSVFRVESVRMSSGADGKPQFEHLGSRTASAREVGTAILGR